MFLLDGTSDYPLGLINLWEGDPLILLPLCTTYPSKVVCLLLEDVGPTELVLIFITPSSLLDSLYNVVSTTSLCSKIFY